MSENLLKLGEVDLRAIATALRSGRLSAPFTTAGLQRLLPSSSAAAVATDLHSLAEQGFNNLQLATLIELLTDDRFQRVSPESVIDLVTTGPEAGGVANRDTRVVVRELFAGAEQSVLVAGYAVYQGQRVFQVLAERMQTKPELKVRMFLDVKRSPGDTTEREELLRRFADRFRRFDWPQDCRLPEVFFYPLSLEDSHELRASLHAKCVVVDRKLLFVSSAKFHLTRHDSMNHSPGFLLNQTSSWTGHGLRSTYLTDGNGTQRFA